MRSGSLRHRVTLQSPTGSRDAVGERTTSWTDIATVWASVGPLTTRELMAAGQPMSEVSHRVRVRYSSTIAALDASWRVLFGSRVLVIQGVRNIDERNKEFELLCSEGVREE